MTRPAKLAIVVGALLAWLAITSAMFPVDWAWFSAFKIATTMLFTFLLLRWYQR